MSDKILKIAAFLLLFAAFCAWVATGHSEECWECITRADAWTDKWPAGEKAKGDIIVCMPQGHKWSPKEKDTKKYKIITICAPKDQVEALQSFQDDKPNRKRFTAIKVDDKPVIADKKTSLAVTPADAKAVVEADKLETFEIPAEVK